MDLIFSAGVGRTGTFIGLDALYHFARRGNNLDIPLYVNKMRQQRMNMIQTLVRFFALSSVLFCCSHYVVNYFRNYIISWLYIFLLSFFFLFFLLLLLFVSEQTND